MIAVERARGNVHPILNGSRPDGLNSSSLIVFQPVLPLPLGGGLLEKPR